MVELLLDNSFQNDLKKMGLAFFDCCLNNWQNWQYHRITKQTIWNILTNPLIITFEEYAGLDQIIKQLAMIAFT